MRVQSHGATQVGEQRWRDVRHALRHTQQLRAPRRAGGGASQARQRSRAVAKAAPHLRRDGHEGQRRLVAADAGPPQVRLVEARRHAVARVRGVGEARQRVVAPRAEQRRHGIDARQERQQRRRVGRVAVVQRRHGEDAALLGHLHPAVQDGTVIAHEVLQVVGEHVARVAEEAPLEGGRQRRREDLLLPIVGLVVSGKGAIARPHAATARGHVQHQRVLRLQRQQLAIGVGGPPRQCQRHAALPPPGVAPVEVVVEQRAEEARRRIAPGARVVPAARSRALGGGICQRVKVQRRGGKRGCRRRAGRRAHGRVDLHEADEDWLLEPSAVRHRHHDLLP